jgi:hypothetical protein
MPLLRPSIGLCLGFETSNQMLRSIRFAEFDYKVIAPKCPHVVDGSISDAIHVPEHADCKYAGLAPNQSQALRPWAWLALEGIATVGWLVAISWAAVKVDGF